MGLSTIIIITTTGIVISAGIQIYERYDRKKNPDKWAELDRQAVENEKERLKEEREEEERERPNVARDYWEEYQNATRRIPKSEWILLYREEKSSIFKRREQLKDDFYNFPLKTQEYIKKHYSINTKFPHSN